MKTRDILLLSASLAALAVLSGQTTSGPTATTTAELADTNVRASVEKTLDAYTEIVGLSQIAMGRAVDPKVKAHAELTAEVIGKARDELQGIMPSVAHAPGMRPQNVFDERGWLTKKAEEFDEAYLDKLSDLLGEADELLSAAAAGEHERLRQHAADHQPIVRQNRETAQALAEEID